MKSLVKLIFSLSVLFVLASCGTELDANSVPPVGSYKVSETKIETTTSESTTTTEQPTTTTTQIVVSTVTTVAPKVWKQPAKPNTNGFLSCVKNRESRGNYGVVNPSSGAGGAYQFLPSTWNNTARHIGRNDLVGVNPASASPATQDMMANALYTWQGSSPWNGPGC